MLVRKGDHIAVIPKAMHTSAGVLTEGLEIFDGHKLAFTR